MKVSVIIAGNGAGTPLHRCLERLLVQADEGLQTIVAFGGCPNLAEELASYDVVAVSRGAPTALHVLRAEALRQATGDVIAILDPYSIVSPDWLQTVRSSHAAHANQAVGGPVDLDRSAARGLVDWALYINEYGMFAPPMAAQAMELLPGCNVSYKRAALFENGAPRRPELWKTFVNDQLRASGEELLIEPNMIVALDKSLAFRDYLSSRFDHGRCYGAMSSIGMSPASKLLRVAAAPILPFLLLVRWGRRYWARGRSRGKFLMTLPHQLLMFGSWIAGETVGRLAGPGASCSRLYY